MPIIFLAAIGRPVEVRVGRTYNEHINAIGSDAIDIAYMGPAPYVEMVAKFGKKPLLARQVIAGNPYLRGEIVVRQDSPFRTLADLRGKCFLFGDINSTMSYVLPQRMLEGAGVPLSRLGSYKSLEGHKNVALAVLAGSCDAGAVKSEVFREYEPKGLRALAELPLVADHVFVANTRLPASLVTKLRTLFMKLNELPAGRKGIPLESVLASHALVHAAEGDHFRSALEGAAARCGIPVVRVPARELDSRAARADGRPVAALRALLDRVGRPMGPPWGADQKAASLLAWLVLATPPKEDRA